MSGGATDRASVRLGRDLSDNAAASARSVAMAQTVVSVSPTLSASAPANSPAGRRVSSASISATLAGGSGPTGTVTFKVRQS